MTPSRSPALSSGTIASETINSFSFIGTASPDPPRSWDRQPRLSIVGQTFLSVVARRAVAFLPPEPGESSTALRVPSAGRNARTRARVDRQECLSHQMGHKPMDRSVRPHQVNSPPRQSCNLLRRRAAALADVRHVRVLAVAVQFLVLAQLALQFLAAGVQ